MIDHDSQTTSFDHVVLAGFLVLVLLSNAKIVLANLSIKRFNTIQSQLWLLVT